MNARVTFVTLVTSRCRIVVIVVIGGGTLVLIHSASGRQNPRRLSRGTLVPVVPFFVRSPAQPPDGQ